MIAWICGATPGRGRRWKGHQLASSWACSLIVAAFTVEFTRMRKGLPTVATARGVAAVLTSRLDPVAPTVAFLEHFELMNQHVGF